jgi:hypothetical protein
MADAIESLFDEPYHEFSQKSGGKPTRLSSIAFLAEQGLEAGMTLDEVAEEIGRSPAQVAHALRRAGLECPDWEREDAFRRGLYGPLFRATDAQAAEICGVSIGAMAGWRHSNGIKTNGARS